MKVPKIKAKARKLGVTPGKMKKTELIHAIQTAEGYNACFGHSNGFCDNGDCCFMPDCLKTRL
jgi:hypothetical protein